MYITTCLNGPTAPVAVIVTSESTDALLFVPDTAAVDTVRVLGPVYPFAAVMSAMSVLIVFVATGVPLLKYDLKVWTPNW